MDNEGKWKSFTSNKIHILAQVHADDGTLLKCYHG
jgi:hypothetical protein